MSAPILRGINGGPEDSPFNCVGCGEGGAGDEVQPHAGDAQHQRVAYPTDLPVAWHWLDDDPMTGRAEKPLCPLVVLRKAWNRWSVIEPIEWRSLDRDGARPLVVSGGFKTPRAAAKWAVAEVERQQTGGEYPAEDRWLDGLASSNPGPVQG